MKLLLSERFPVKSLIRTVGSVCESKNYGEPAAKLDLGTSEVKSSLT